jgi:ribosome modulation factor
MGYAAFSYGEDPALLCPYEQMTGVLSFGYKEDWYDGWNEAKADAEKERESGAEATDGEMDLS